MLQLTELQKQILMDCADDYTGLWFIIDTVRDVFPMADPETIQKKTIEVIRELLEAKFIEAGCLNDWGRRFDLWSLPVDETIDRIVEEWTALGREPHLDEVVWFVATAMGEEKIGWREPSLS